MRVVVNKHVVFDKLTLKYLYQQTTDNDLIVAENMLDNYTISVGQAELIAA
jgi:hypothetical protein